MIDSHVDYYYNSFMLRELYVHKTKFVWIHALIDVLGMDICQLIKWCYVF